MEEEIIKALKEHDLNPIMLNFEEYAECIENLIARNKELKDDLYATNCIVNEQIDVLRDSIPKSKVEQVLKRLDKEEKEKLKGVKGQDRYFIKQMYQAKRSVIEQLLQEGDK